MTTQKYIDENLTSTFEAGVRVKMVDCLEAKSQNTEGYKTATNSFRSQAGYDVVFLEDYSGYFMCKYLEKI